MQNFCCKRVEEKSEVIKYICIDDGCQSISVCCKFCKQDTHQNHQQDCIQLKNIIDKILEEYTLIQTQVIQEIKVIEMIFKESIYNFQKNLKDIFRTSIDNDELIHNLEYAHLRKSQVKYFVQASQQLKQQINSLRQICNQFENKNAVILQDISQCEIDINKIKQQQSKQTQILSQITSQITENSLQQQQSISEIKVQEQQINRKIIFLDNDEDQENQQVEIDENNKEDQANQILNIKQINNQLQNSKESIIEYNQSSQIYQNSSIHNLGFNGLLIVINQPQNIFKNNTLQRIHEIVNKPLQYFCNPQGQNVFASDGKNVKIYDVIPFKGVQGSYYYVMYYLASFCPQKLYEIFKTKEITSNGQYEFVVKDKTHENVILQVNDTIPNNIDKRILLSNNYSICFTMLMKAIAQHLVGYETILNQQENLQFLQFIFNCGIIMVITDDDNFSEQIKIELDSQSLILFGLKVESQIKVIQILDLINVKNLLNEDTLLLKLRSAYGRDIYQGDWGFQSPYWTDDLKNKLNVSNEDDGIFYMDFISFISEPKLIYSLRINHQLSASQKFFLKKQQASYFRIDITNDDNYLIKFELLQQQTDLQLSIQILISDFHTNELIQINNMTFVDGLSCVFKKGNYVIYVKCPEINKNIIEAKILVFGLTKVELHQIQKIENYKNLVFEKEVDKKGKIIENTHFVKIRKLELNDKGWFIYHFYCQSKDGILIKQMDQAQKNYRICKPFNNKLIVQKLFNKQQLIIIFKLPESQFVLPNFTVVELNSRQFN